MLLVNYIQRVSECVCVWVCVCVCVWVCVCVCVSVYVCVCVVFLFCVSLTTKGFKVGLPTPAVGGTVSTPVSS